MENISLSIFQNNLIPVVYSSLDLPDPLKHTFSLLYYIILHFTEIISDKVFLIDVHMTTFEAPLLYLYYTTTVVVLFFIILNFLF